MHVRAPSATLCAPNNPYSYSNHGLSPWKKNIHCPRRWTTCPLSKFPPLVPLSFRSVSCRKKFSNTVCYIPYEFFRSTKVKYRQDLFETYSWLFRVWNSLLFLFLFALYNYITQNGVASKFTERPLDKRAASSFGQRLIRSRLVRSH